MKILFDYFPLILFFIAFKVADIYVATGVAIASTLLQNGYFYYKHRRFEKMHLITLALVTVLGGATIFLKDERFIKWKPTLVNWGFAVAFFGSQFVGKKPIVERMMGQTIRLPGHIWTRLTLAWTLFFVSLGLVNLYVAFTYPLETWVNFKVFGMMGLTVAFIVAQAAYLSRYVEEPAVDPADTPTGEKDGTS